MRTVACVVAYNRAALLQRVLQNLTDQTEPVDVLVVDNASTDATAEVVAGFGDRVMYFNPGANLGGAGGFAWALELAMALGYDAAYLLDDDAVPQLDALETLLSARRSSSALAAMPYLASQPIAADESRTPAGVPEPSVHFHDHVRALPAGAIALDHAAFLGVLIDLEAARATALPYPEFFIWCDDVEYTTRLGGRAGGACVPASRLVHESLEMEAGTSRRPLGWKYRYKVRNTLWLLRWGLPDAGRATQANMLFSVVRATVNELLGAPGKVETVRTTFEAWSSGLLGRKPRAHRVGSLLAGSADARAWVAGQRVSV